MASNNEIHSLQNKLQHCLTLLGAVVACPWKSSDSSIRITDTNEIIRISEEEIEFGAKTYEFERCVEKYIKNAETYLNWLYNQIPKEITTVEGISQITTPFISIEASHSGPVYEKGTYLGWSGETIFENRFYRSERQIIPTFLGNYITVSDVTSDTIAFSIGMGEDKNKVQILKINSYLVFYSPELFDASEK